MKIPAIIPAGLCAAAGALLAMDAVCGYFSGSGGPMGQASEFDVFSFSVGMYFLGKGFFIHALLTQGQSR